MKKKLLSAREYHEQTCHVRNQIAPHHFDFDNYPLPFKSYEAPETIKLAADFSECSDHLDLNALSCILFLAYGVTSVKQNYPIPFFYRTIPSAGGLYPCHLYVAVHQMPGIETGVYYFDPIHFSLVRLHGDMAFHETDRVFFMVTASFYTSAWKYRDRAFRYMLLDAGHLVGNLSLALGAYDMGHALLYDFEDRAISDFLGLDTSQEVPLVCVSTGRNKSVPAAAFQGKISGSVDKRKEFPDLTDRTRLVQYELLEQIHALGSSYGVPKTAVPLPRITEKKPLKRVAVPENTADSGPGFAQAFASVSLDQQWIKAAGTVFLFMANLKELEKTFGPRGYRYVMFDAGRIAQQIYLGTQDLGLGCCGIGAIYDGEANVLLGLNEESVLLYAVAAGPVKNGFGMEVEYLLM